MTDEEKTPAITTPHACITLGWIVVESLSRQLDALDAVAGMHPDPDCRKAQRLTDKDREKLAPLVASGVSMCQEVCERAFGSEPDVFWQPLFDDPSLFPLIKDLLTLTARLDGWSAASPETSKTSQLLKLWRPLFLPGHAALMLDGGSESLFGSLVAPTPRSRAWTRLLAHGPLMAYCTLLMPATERSKLVPVWTDMMLAGHVEAFRILSQTISEHDLDACWRKLALQGEAGLRGLRAWVQHPAVVAATQAMPFQSSEPHNEVASLMNLARFKVLVESVAASDSPEGVAWWLDHWLKTGAPLDQLRFNIDFGGKTVQVGLLGFLAHTADTVSGRAERGQGSRICHLWNLIIDRLDCDATDRHEHGEAVEHHALSKTPDSSTLLRRMIFESMVQAPYDADPLGILLRHPLRHAEVLRKMGRILGAMPTYDLLEIVKSKDALMIRDRPPRQPIKHLHQLVAMASKTQDHAAMVAVLTSLIGKESGLLEGACGIQSAWRQGGWSLEERSAGLPDDIGLAWRQGQAVIDPKMKAIQDTHKSLTAADMAWATYRHRYTDEPSMLDVLMRRGALVSPNFRPPSSEAVMAWRGCGHSMLWQGRHPLAVAALDTSGDMMDAFRFWLSQSRRQDWSFKDQDGLTLWDHMAASVEGRHRHVEQENLDLTWRASHAMRHLLKSLADHRENPTRQDVQFLEGFRAWAQESGRAEEIAEDLARWDMEMSSDLEMSIFAKDLRALRELESTLNAARAMDVTMRTPGESNKHGRRVRKGTQESWEARFKRQYPDAPLAIVPNVDGSLPASVMESGGQGPQDQEQDRSDPTGRMFHAHHGLGLATFATFVATPL